MSNFMKGIKQTLGTQQPQQVLSEADRAIMDIENKKRTISQASMNEQNAIKSKISEEYRKIGETSYSLYIEDGFELDKITGMFETIRGYYQTLDEKQVKLNEILARYDEELAILRPAPPAGQAACPNCGTGYMPGETLFCSKCGSKVPEINAGATVPPAPQSACPHCSAALIPDSAFCAGCGNKL